MDRLRQKDNLDKRIITGQTFSKAAKRITRTYAYNMQYEGDTQQVQDVWTPARRKHVTNNIVMNPVSMSKLVLLPPKQDVVNYHSNQGDAIHDLVGVNAGMGFLGRFFANASHWDYLYGSVPFTTVDTKQASYLYQRALSRASSAEFDFGVTVGEIAETASFLAKPLSSIVKLSTKAFAGVSHVWTNGTKVSIRVARNATKRQLRRISEHSAAANPFNPSLRVLDESANHWLAYKFGVLPIIDDIGKALEFKEKNLQRLLGVRRAKVKGVKTDTTTSWQQALVIWNYFDGTCFAVRRVEDRHTFGLYFKDEITSPLANFAAGLGFAPFNCFTLAWELIPLSFVVDRFIDIKSFVKGNLGGLTKQILSYYCTRKIATRYSVQVSDLRFGAPGAKIPCQASEQITGHATLDQMARVVKLDRPNFPVINPLWQQQLTADATNLSLIWGRLRTFVGKLK